MLERDLRAMAVVKRWGIVPTIKDQSDAEHTFFVICYVNDICTYLEVTDDVRLAALKYAIWHDMDEILTGDAPGPHKKHFMIKNSNWVFKSMEKIFRRRTDRMYGKFTGQSEGKNEAMHAIVKAADLIESVLFLVEELRLGNTNVHEHIAQLSDQAFAAIDKLNRWYSELLVINLRHDVAKAIGEAHRVPMQNSRITYDGDDY